MRRLSIPDIAKLADTKSAMPRIMIVVIFDALGITALHLRLMLCLQREYGHRWAERWATQGPLLA